MRFICGESETLRNLYSRHLLGRALCELACGKAPAGILASEASTDTHVYSFLKERTLNLHDSSLLIGS